MTRYTSSRQVSARSPVAAAWVAREGLRRTHNGAAVLDHPALGWVARIGLAALFTIGLLDLAGDTAELL